MKTRIVEVHNASVSIVETLARFYAYEMSVYTRSPCPEDGLFFCRDYNYWRDPQNTYFLMRVDGKIAGFAAIDHTGANQLVDANVADFLVLPKFRRSGVGRMSAFQLFDKFVGNWEVMQMRENRVATKFWTTVIRQYTSGRYSKSCELASNYGREMVVHRFNNSSHVANAKKA